MATVRVQLRIRGLVQGVFYRGSTQHKAQELGLSGWVRNEADGSVTALAQGPKPTVEALIAWCREGPPSARVDSVEVAYEDPADELAGFRITGKAHLKNPVG